MPTLKKKINYQKGKRSRKIKDLVARQNVFQVFTPAPPERLWHLGAAVTYVGKPPVSSCIIHGVKLAFN